jgi:beta-lactam-binding protein with PASTA domain
MRPVIRFVLLALVLLMVAMVSALTAMRMAIHGREVAVPKLVGLAPAEAEREAIANGLLLAVEARFYSPQVPEGRIMSQVPAPGAKVRRGWRVRVAESLGPQRMITPNLVGQSPRAAEINVRRRGLELGGMAVARIPELPPDQVVAQNPAPNAGATSPKISVLVTAPVEPQAYLMPPFIGMNLADASKALQEAGMKLGPITMVAPEAANSVRSSGSIVKQNPAPGQKVLPGTVVSFEVAK